MGTRGRTEDGSRPREERTGQVLAPVGEERPALDAVEPLGIPRTPASAPGETGTIWLRLPGFKYVGPMRISPGMLMVLVPMASIWAVLTTWILVNGLQAAVGTAVTILRPAG